MEEIAGIVCTQDVNRPVGFTQTTETEDNEPQELEVNPSNR
jgi:hypothetical protein